MARDQMLSDTQPLDVPESGVGITAMQNDATAFLSMNNAVRTLAQATGLLTKGEVSDCLEKFIATAKETIAFCRGQIVRADGDRIVATFSPRNGETAQSRRALDAAAGLLVAAERYRSWVNLRFGERGLPGLMFAIGIHTGNKRLTLTGETQPGADLVGEGVNVAMRLETVARNFGCSLLASGESLRHAGPEVRTGRVHSVGAKSDGSGLAIEAVEVTGIDGFSAAAEFQKAVEANAKLAALTRTGASDGTGVTDASVATHPVQPALDITLPIKGYRALRKLGQGGMSSVYLIERQTDGLRLALKLLDTASDDDMKMLAMFIQEYEVIDLITHPNVVAIYDQGVTDKGLFILMEYFSAGDLRQRIRAGLAPALALQVTMQVACGLREIHRHGIVHRDLKPANLMIRAGGTIAVADFGIARAARGSITRSRSRGIMGTPYYISPEQIADAKVDHRTDLYALGVILFELLTKKRPFDGETISQILRQHKEAPIPVLPAYLAQFQPIVERLMAKNPDARYQTAEELMPVLNSLLQKL